MQRILRFIPILIVLLLLCQSALTAHVLKNGYSSNSSCGISQRTVYLMAAVLTPPDEAGNTFIDKPERIRIINLGPVVNHKGLDYAPTVSADGRTLYFVSDRPGSTPKEGGDPSHDFYMVKKLENKDTNFFPPKNIDTAHAFGLKASVNTIFNEGVASIAADRQTLVFTGCNRPDGYGDCDLYITDVEGDVWGKPRNLGRQVNSEKWDSQPTISADKTRIYFASNRPGPNGDANTDIWYTDFDEETNQWKAAANLTAINTPGKDWSPFIAADGTTLFFASDSHKPNLGGMDFYFVKKTGTGADGKDTWGKPVNIGAPINTDKNESFISLPASGDVIYFSSDRKDKTGYQGSLDIFMAFVPTFFKAAQVRTVVVDECSGANIPATISIKNMYTGRGIKDSVTFSKTLQESIFSDKDFGNPKDSIKFVDLEIVASNPQYGEKKVMQRINKPEITEDAKEAEKADIYDVKITLGQRPVLGAEIEAGQHQKQNANDPMWQSYKGLVMRQVAAISLYPLLNYVFFDLGGYQIPSRYILFKSPAETASFSDEKIPGGTFEKYYHVLNIYGYRLKKNPNVKFKVVGYTDNNTLGISKEELTPDLSKNRATQVYNYLKDIWQIDASRMTLEFKNYPEKPSNPKDTQGIVENRRVEILCDEWEVIKPILDKDPKVFPQPEEMTFTMKNGIDDALVAKRRIVITRSDKPWATLTDVGTTQATTKWDWQDTKGEYPNCASKISETKGNSTELAPYKAQLIVTSTTGQECVSNPISIPVRYVSTSGMVINNNDPNAVVEKTLEKYNLILFQFNSFDPGPRNDRILKEYVFPRCFKSTDVDIEGHTDVVGMYDANKKLSDNRARVTREAIEKNTQGVKTIKSVGVGEDNPLYDNTLPEGRFYNRTVRVQIETPLKDAQLDMGTQDKCGE
ncbi:MAG: PD40 domain-containing protein [Candidatus Kapabacteria bacterium]|nr:PD40 domain-containing protein [Candidatus Kapabacteria bacterium]